MKDNLDLHVMRANQPSEGKKHKQKPNKYSEVEVKMLFFLSSSLSFSPCHLFYYFLKQQCVQLFIKKIIIKHLLNQYLWMHVS